MKLFLIALATLSTHSAFAAPRMVDVSINPVVDGNFCRYEATETFTSFPDYEVFSVFGSPTTWTKDIKRTLATVEIKSTNQYVLHLQPEPYWVDANETCPVVKLKVMIR